MSLITRCPACRTMFRVVPDQLRISNGWVRCGKCEEIFDAALQMQEVPASEVPAADSPDTVPYMPEPATAGAAQPRPKKGGRKKAAGTRVAGSVGDGAPEDAVRARVAVADTAGQAEQGQPSEFRARADDASAALSARSASTAPVSVPASGGMPEETAAELSFMRKHGDSPWQRTWVRVVLVIAGHFLLFALAVQVVVHERDRLVAMEPDLKPMVEVVCEQLGCVIRPLRQIDSVVIDSSAFSKVKGDIYKLSMTLKNRSPIDLAMPMVELTLTDTLDQPLLRKVLKPEELGASSGVMAASSESQITLALSVQLNGMTERVAGYRLLAFYP